MAQKIVLVIIGMSVVTYLPRMLPLVVLSKLKLPPLFTAWLRYIPVAVLSALLVPGVLLSHGRLAFTLQNKALLASIPSLLVAARTKNLFLTVSAGIVTMYLLQQVM